MSTIEGTVKFFNNEKGFGFITPADGSKDIFVHKNSVQSGHHLSDGCKVKYNTENTPKGLSAIDVIVTD